MSSNLTLSANIMKRITLFFQWYKQLRAKQYSAFNCFFYALYNSKRFNLDGTYLKRNKT